MTSFSPPLSSPQPLFTPIPEFNFHTTIPIMGTHAKLLTKPRFLCLHGFRTSAAILKKQVGKWPASVLDQLDLHFLDAPFPAEGKSDVEGIFDPPYFEWFQFSPVRLFHLSFYFFANSQTLFSFVYFLPSSPSQEFTEYRNFDECLSFIEDYMLKHGPFDGFLGFSQVISSIFLLISQTGLSRLSISSWISLNFKISGGDIIGRSAGISSQGNLTVTAACSATGFYIYSIWILRNWDSDAAVASINGCRELLWRKSRRSNSWSSSAVRNSDPNLWLRKLTRRSLDAHPSIF